MKKILLGTIALLLVGSMVFAGGKKDAAKEEVSQPEIKKYFDKIKDLFQ